MRNNEKVVLAAVQQSGGSAEFHRGPAGPLQGPFKGMHRRSIREIPNFKKNPDLALRGTWEALVACQRLLQGLVTISVPGKLVSEKWYVRRSLDVLPILHLMKFGRFQPRVRLGGDKKQN